METRKSLGQEMEEGLGLGHGSIMFGRAGDRDRQTPLLQVGFDTPNPAAPTWAENDAQALDSLASSIWTKEGMGAENLNRWGEESQHDPERFLLNGASIHNQLTWPQVRPETTTHRLHLGNRHTQKETGAARNLFQRDGTNPSHSDRPLGIIGTDPEVPLEDLRSKLAKPPEPNDSNLHTVPHTDRSNLRPTCPQRLA